MKNKTIIISLCILFIPIHVIGAENSHPTEVRKVSGTPLSRQGYIAKNIIGYVSASEKSLNGVPPRSWNEVEEVDELRKGLIQARGVDITTAYGFTTSNDHIPIFGRGKAILMHTQPFIHERTGEKNRFIIWRDRDGRYQFTSFPETEVHKIISEYNIQFIPSSKPPSPQDSSIIQAEPEEKLGGPTAAVATAPYSSSNSNSSNPPETRFYDVRFWIYCAVGLICLLTAIIYRLRRPH